MPKHSSKDWPEDKDDWCCVGYIVLKFNVSFTVVNTGNGIKVGYSGEMKRILETSCRFKSQGCGECEDTWPSRSSWDVKGQTQGTMRDSLTKDGWTAWGRATVAVDLGCCYTTSWSSDCLYVTKQETFKVSGEVEGLDLGGYLLSLQFLVDRHPGVGGNMVGRVSHALWKEYGLGGTQPPTLLPCCDKRTDPPVN